MPAGTLTGYLAVLAADGHPVATADAGLRSGQFHDVVLAGTRAYRFPRDEESRRLLPSRAALLTALAAAKLPVAVPVPLGTDWVRRPLGSCYLATTRLTGVPPGPGRTDDPRAVRALAAQLADVLRGLARAGRDDGVRQAVPGARPGDWRDWADQVRAVLFPMMTTAGRRRAEAEIAAVQGVAATGDALVHADLGGANLLFRDSAGEPRLAGILDWDGACIGGQANDLASLAATFGWPLAARIDHRLHEPGDPAGGAADGVAGGVAAGSLLPAARRIAATFALQQALPAALSGDEASLADGLSGYS